jgi:glycosyltransferase involved in cell wall biosynthesis
MTDRPKVAWLYLGRRGAMAKFALDLARSIGRDRRNVFVVAESNALAAEFGSCDADVRFVPVFVRDRDALAVWRSGRLARSLRQVLVQENARTVVELMGHVWSPFFEGAIKAAGVRRVTLLHDWRAHPGDASALATRWLAGSALRADRIVTLSHFVGSQVLRASPSSATRLVELFHPDFDYGVSAGLREEGPLRIAFLGRLASYKGLDVLVDAVERARAQGGSIELSVAGAGDIEEMAPRLRALGVRVTNRWLSDAEIAVELARCDVVAATYHEASQSGVVAAALGAGRPVIATPVGALTEQIQDGETGLVAARVDGAAVAEVILRLARDRALLLRQSLAIKAGAPTRTMRAFAEALQTELA